MQTNIYGQYAEKYGNNAQLEECVQNTVNALQDTSTDSNRPVLLLGDIQSGKTRGFIGAMALAFDRGYQVAVVFTKGTRALVKQTVNRFTAEFETSIDEDLMQVYDIMEMPVLNDWTLERQKLIIVVKKEKNNMKRLEQMFFDQCPALMAHRILVVDDEADFVSNGYRRVKNDDGDRELDINVISRQISEFRSSVHNGCDYLQVTATPYSLYLQPDEIEVRGEAYEPVRPRYTQLLPIHDRYIGSTYYFEHSRDESSPAFCMFHPVEIQELIDLDNTHGTIRNNVLRSNRVTTFRTAITTYITAACIRSIQEELSGNRIYKSSFIIHTGTARRTHTNQEDLTSALIDALKEDAAAGGEVLNALISEAYDDLRDSISKTDYHLPSLARVQEMAKQYLRYVSIRKINSENDVTALLNPRTGELRLDGPLNIFIGGQILDRGITIQNLIGFFYGRNPRQMQQDTVMQHCRIFGARSLEDMAVTRLYTTIRIYEAMRRMHESDKALRATIDEFGPAQPVNFMRSDEMGVVRLCSPSKLLISNTVTLRPSSRLLPYGFQTLAPSYLRPIREGIAESLRTFAGSEEMREPFFVHVDEALTLANACYDQYKVDESLVGCTREEFLAALRYSASQAAEPYRDQVAIFGTNEPRNVSRIKENRRGRMYSDSAHDGRTDSPIAAACTELAPCLFMSLQAGKETNGWRDAPFYWPVLFNPQSLRTTIFTTNTDDADDALLAEDERNAATA